MAFNAALYQGILDNPDDDAVRLVYADWLEENGDPQRAEFIRAQCYLAHMDRAEPSYEKLHLRAAALLEANRQTWQQEAPRWARNHVEFRRGFVEVIRCSSADWLRGGKGPFRRVPLRAVQLWNVLSGSEELLRHLATERLTGLQFDPVPLPASAVAMLAQGPSLAGLRSLSLNSGAIGDPGLTVLAQSPHLAQLTKLDLNRNNLQAAGLTALASSPTIRRLTELSLSMNSVSANGLVALTQSHSAATLENLDLSMNRLGDPGVEALVRGDLPRLRWLSLAYNQLLDIEPLAEWELLRTVVGLDLHSNALGSAGFRTLVRSPHLAALRWLDRHENQIEPDWFEVIRDSPLLGNLTMLNLSENPLGDEGAKILLESAWLEKIGRLDLRGTGISLEMRQTLQQRLGRAVRLDADD